MRVIKLLHAILEFTRSNRSAEVGIVLYIHMVAVASLDKSWIDIFYTMPAQYMQFMIFK